MICSSEYLFFTSNLLSSGLQGQPPLKSGGRRYCQRMCCVDSACTAPAPSSGIIGSIRVMRE